jgi:hypothetical protein
MEPARNQQGCHARLVETLGELTERTPLRILPKEIQLLAVIALFCVAGSNVVVIRPVKALNTSHKTVLVSENRIPAFVMIGKGQEG